MSTSRPIQQSLSRQGSQYSEDLDNLRNSSRLFLDQDPEEDAGDLDLRDPFYGHPEHTNNLLNMRGPNTGAATELQLMDSGGGGSGMGSSLILTDPTKTPAQLEHTTIHMPPLYPNAILQGEERREGEEICWGFGGGIDV